MMECLRGCVGLLLYLQRSVPAINKYGDMDNCLLEDKNDLPPKLRVIPYHVGSADPCWPPLATAFCWVSAWWVLMSDRSVPGLGWSVWSSLWALFVGMTQHRIFCAFVLRLSSVFALCRVWVPAIQESPKLVEMVSITPYNYFWCFKVMKRCRS